MKHRVFSLLPALLCSAMAMAGWEYPVPKASTSIIPSEDQNGQTYRLYNEEGRYFLKSGAKWGTQGSKNATSGNIVYFKEYPNDNDTWNIWSYVNETKGWDSFFFSSSEGRDYLITDCSSRGHDMWKAEWNGDKVRFYMGGDDEGEFYSEAEQGKRVYIAEVDGDDNGLWASLEENSHPIDWTLVSEQDLVTFNMQLDTYNEAQELQKDIEKSQELYPNLDISTIEAVYDNTSSTLQELKDARTNLANMQKEYASTQASAGNPQDATINIVNPDYGKSNNNSGWQGTSMTVSDGCAELWNQKKFDAYQDIQLANGIYKLSLNGLYRVSDADDKAYYNQDGKLLNQYLLTTYLYAQSGEHTFRSAMQSFETGYSTESLTEHDYHYTGSDLYAPNRRSSFTTYNEAGYYQDNEVFVAVTDGKLRIGLKNENITSEKEWCVFDDWRLTFYGDGDDAYEMWRDEMISTDYADTLALTSLKDAYDEAVSKAESATTREDIIAALEEVQTLKEQIHASALDYVYYNETIDEVRGYLEEHDDFAGSDRDFLEEYLESDEEPGTYPNGGYEYIVGEALLTRAELEAESAYVKELLQTAITKGITDGTEITNLLKNPDMSLANFEGWTLTASVDDNFKSHLGKGDPYVAQGYHKVFGLSQTIEGVQDGLYQVNVNALFRWDDESKEAQESPVVLFLNDFETPVQNILDDLMPEEEAVNHVNCYIDNVGTWPSDKLYYGGYGPFSVDGCSYAFAAGRYQQTVYGLVTDGKLTLGVKDTRPYNDDWCVFTNFRVIYRAKNPDAIDAVLESFSDRAAGYEDDTKEIYFDHALLEDLKSIIAKGQSSTDNNEKYNLLIDANETFKKITACVDVYKQLYDKLDLLYNAYNDALAEGSITDEEMTAFENDTYYNVIDNILEGVYTKEQAQELLKTISRNPLIDYITVQGDMKDSSWGQDLGLYRLERQADGTFQGTMETTDRSFDDGYGNRSGFFFTYAGVNYDCADPTNRRVSSKNCDFALRAYNSGQWFANFGGKWKVTISENLDSVHFEPIGREIFPNYIYAVGDFADGYWKANLDHRLSHVGDGVYKGIVSMGSTDMRLTIFGGGWSPKKSNWTESRFGSATGTVDVQDGDTIKDIRTFIGDTSWRLQANTTYNVTIDLNAMTAVFAPFEMAGEGTKENPYLIKSREDMLAMRQLLTHSQITYFRLQNDIDMQGIDWKPLNLSEDEYLNWIDFDGANHVISNLTSGDNFFYSGFFGVLCGACRNVGFDNANVNCKLSGTGVLGGYVGHSTFPETTTIENVWVTGKLVNDYDGYTGAIAGNIGGPTVMKNVYSNVDVTSQASIVGGIVGRVRAQLTLENAYAAGIASDASDNFCGIVGGGQNATTPASSYSNIVVWNNTQNIFGTTADGDALSGISYYDGGNFAELQQTVLSWDKDLWFCSGEEDEYPTFWWNQPALAEAGANPYAFGLSSELADGTISVNYSINAQAVAGSVKFYRNDSKAEVGSINLSVDQLTPGEHTVQMNASDLPETVIAWSVEVEGKGVQVPKAIGDSYTVWAPHGLAVDNNVESSHFGRLYVAEGSTSPNDNYISGPGVGNGPGVYVFDPYFQHVKAANGKNGFTGNAGMNGDLSISKNAQFDPKTIRIADDGRVFLGRPSGISTSSVYELNPDDLNADFTPVFVGGELDEATGVTYVDGEFQNRMAVSLAVEGKGDDLKLYVLDCDLAGASFDTNGYGVHRYDLGTRTAWDTVPSDTVEALNNYTIAPGSVSIESDRRGGLWYVQHRASPSAALPSIKHINAQGVEDYSDISLVCNGGGLALSADGNYMAYPVGAKIVAISEVIYTFAGPCLNEIQRFAVRDGSLVECLAFDYAGNLFAGSSYSETVSLYAIPSTTDNIVVTPAAKKYNIVLGDEDDAIDQITVDTAKSGYIYDLSGRRVNKVQKGIFIQDGRKVLK